MTNYVVLERVFWVRFMRYILVIRAATGQECRQRSRIISLCKSLGFFLGDASSSLLAQVILTTHHMDAVPEGRPPCMCE